MAKCTDSDSVILGTCIREALRTGIAVAATVVLAFVLVRTGSGFGMDERELDVRLSAESRSLARAGAGGEGSMAAALAGFARRAGSGDLGNSTSLNRPVAELIGERLPATLPALAIAWVLTLGSAVWAALAAAMRPAAATEKVFTSASALVLSVPGAVLALVFARMRLPVTAALVVAVFPQVYRYSFGVLEGAATSAAVIAARARGIGGVRLGIVHVLRPCAPELIGVTSLTLNLLVSASIPLEALTGTSGLGHLVWQAALGRDTALIAAMTLLVATATLAASSLAEIAAAVLRARSAA